jgi:hypothetical protein
MHAGDVYIFDGDAIVAVYGGVKVSSLYLHVTIRLY